MNSIQIEKKEIRDQTIINYNIILSKLNFAEFLSLVRLLAQKDIYCPYLTKKEKEKLEVIWKNKDFSQCLFENIKKGNYDFKKINPQQRLICYIFAKIMKYSFQRINIKTVKIYYCTDINYCWDRKIYRPTDYHHCAHSSCNDFRCISCSFSCKCYCDKLPDKIIKYGKEYYCDSCERFLHRFLIPYTEKIGVRIIPNYEDEIRYYCRILPREIINLIVNLIK